MKCKERKGKEGHTSKRKTRKGTGRTENVRLGKLRLSIQQDLVPHRGRCPKRRKGWERGIDSARYRKMTSVRFGWLEGRKRGPGSGPC